MDRIASVLEDERDLSLLYALMFAMPGIPCIYYGSEWGAKGARTKYSDRALRPEYKVPHWNELTDTIAKLAKMRTTYRIFTDGDYVQQYIRNRQLIFRRRSERGQLTFALNIEDAPHHANFNAEVEEGIDLFSPSHIRFEGGLDLDPKSFIFCYSDWLK